MIKWLSVACAVVAAFSFSNCGNGNAPTNTETTSPTQISEAESSATNGNTTDLTVEEPIETPEIAEPNQEETVLKISVGEYTFYATLEDNSSAEELREMLAQGSVTVQMEDYGGFEKVGSLGTELTRNDEPITTQPGDIILYQGNQIVIYYGTNSWTFTRLAKINDATDLKAKLGEGTVQVTFSLE